MARAEVGTDPGECIEAHLELPTWPMWRKRNHRVSESGCKISFHQSPWTAGNRNCGGTQMKQVYRVLAFLVAAGVAVQAAAVSYGMFGLIKWVELGGTLDQSTELTPALGGYAGLRCTPRLAFSSSQPFRCSC